MLIWRIFSISHSRIVLSADPDSIVRPSRDQARLPTKFSLPFHAPLAFRLAFTSSISPSIDPKARALPFGDHTTIVTKELALSDFKISPVYEFHNITEPSESPDVS